MTRTGTVSKDLEILPGKSLDLTPWVVRIYALTQLRRALLELILLAGGGESTGGELECPFTLQTISVRRLLIDFARLFNQHPHPSSPTNAIHTLYWSHA